MNKEQLKQLIEHPILKAFIEGKKIEYSIDGEIWSEVDALHIDNFIQYPKRYRIAKEKSEYYMVYNSSYNIESNFNTYRIRLSLNAARTDLKEYESNLKVVKITIEDI